MNSTELKAKMEKAQETVAKKEKTIERHKAQAEKKAAPLLARGYDLDNLKAIKWDNTERAAYKLATGSDLYWDICEYEHKVSDIEEAGKKLEEAKRIAQIWEQKYNDAVIRELTIANEIPEAMKEAKATLADEWTKYDIRYRDKMYTFRKEHSYEEFRKAYTWTEYESYDKSDEELRKANEDAATKWLLNLYNRVIEITGELTNVENIRWGGKGLDGWLEGKNGAVNVWTIEAGGWNIQRLHLRTLVQKRG